jgi:hypothetical protein
LSEILALKLSFQSKLGKKHKSFSKNKSLENFQLSKIIVLELLEWPTRQFYLKFQLFSSEPDDVKTFFTKIVIFFRKNLKISKF